MKSVKELLAKSGDKQREAEIILARILRIDRANLIAHPEKILNVIQTIKYWRAIRALQKNIPLAYIIGQKAFYGLNFFVNKNVLIPRPESELMVDEAIHVIARRSEATTRQSNTIIIDVGTGSGCIPIAIAKNTFDIEIIASDISRAALRVARKNAKQHNVDIQFMRGDLLEPIFKSPITNHHLLITANLPYLTREWTEAEPSIAKEPRLALVADNINGLSLYEKLFKQIKLLIDNCELRTVNCELIVEIDPRQATDAIYLSVKYFPDKKIEIKKDLAGRDRILLVG